MNKKESFEEKIEELIKRVEEADTEDFFELAKILDEDPKKDLAGADLHLCDLSGGDLEGANLRKTNLSSANLRKTNLRWADLSYADLSGADFTGADVTNTIFDHVRAENAIFCDNLGIYERIKLELIDKGAVFLEKKEIKDKEVIIEDQDKGLNEKAYFNLINDPKKFAQYKDEWVAFFDGKLVATHNTEQELVKYLDQHPKYKNKSGLIIQIKEDSKIIPMAPHFLSNSN